MPPNLILILIVEAPAVVSPRACSEPIKNGDVVMFVMPQLTQTAPAHFSKSYMHDSRVIVGGHVMQGSYSHFGEYFSGHWYYRCVPVCVCVYIYIYIYIYTWGILPRMLP